MIHIHMPQTRKVVCHQRMKFDWKHIYKITLFGSEVQTRGFLKTFACIGMVLGDIWYKSIKQFSSFGKILQKEENLKQIAETLSSIASKAKNYTLSETEDWFDKVTVNRNMKELTNLSKQFGKIAEESNALQQRMSGLYEDMGYILNRYYEIEGEPEDQEDEKIKAGLEEPKGHKIDEGDYEAFFQSAMKKFGISSPDELDDDKKKEFFNYVDKNYKAKNEKD